VALAVLVQGTLVVEDRIGALYAGAGVAQDVEVHRARNIVGQVRGSRSNPRLPSTRWVGLAIPMLVTMTMVTMLLVLPLRIWNERDASIAER
jgi:tetrahydromethanopterin S-methyltransferase subunit F